LAHDPQYFVEWTGESYPDLYYEHPLFIPAHTLDIPQHTLDANMLGHFFSTLKASDDHGFAHFCERENGKYSDTTRKETHASIIDEYQELGSKPPDMSTMTHRPPIHGVSETFRYEVKTKNAISQGQGIVQSDGVKCTETGCQNRSFVDRAGLHRHQREVHRLDIRGNPAQMFLCPEKNCSRHRKGFARQWNMEQHHRRRHTNVRFNFGETRQSLSTTAEDSEELDGNPDLTVSVGKSKKDNLNIREELHARLNQLQGKKKRLDDEMDALQKVISQFESQDLRNVE